MSLIPTVGLCLDPRRSDDFPDHLSGRGPKDSLLLGRGWGVRWLGLKGLGLYPHTRIGPPLSLWGIVALNKKISIVEGQREFRCRSKRW